MRSALEPTTPCHNSLLICFLRWLLHPSLLTHSLRHCTAVAAPDVHTSCVASHSGGQHNTLLQLSLSRHHVSATARLPCVPVPQPPPQPDHLLPPCCSLPRTVIINVTLRTTWGLLASDLGQGPTFGAKDLHPLAQSSLWPMEL
jgi:hypothetical protein